MSKRGPTLTRLIRTAVPRESLATDQQLLRRFADESDQQAFAALVRRHTPLVLGVCRRLLPAGQDAEDACQATFLILARKANSSRWQTSVANWLFTTARRVARDARLAAERRAARERKAAVPELVQPIDRISGRELLAVVDEELDRLPAAYREPLMLFHLEQLARDEIAVRLGIPAGTVKIRLERGRKKLGDALTRRGVALGAGLLALAATSRAGASPPRLLDSILAAAGGSPSPAVAALAQGVAVNQILAKAKVIAVALVGVGALGFGIAAMPTAAEPQQRLQRPPAPPDGGDKPRRSPAAEAKDRTISGKVVGPDGKPVAAELILLRSDAGPRSLGKPNTDGSFSAAVPAGSIAQLVALADGLGAGFAVISPQVTGDVTLRLVKDNPVKGRVVDTQGKPVAGATVFPQDIEDYGMEGADVFLHSWKTRNPQQGWLHGEQQLSNELRADLTLPDGRTVLAAKTGADGAFELGGLGAERIIDLFVRGPGIADTNVLVVNRADFDPAESNRAAADNYERRMFKDLRASRPFQRLYGPEVSLVAEQEKLIRGLVKDRDTGKPRAGVHVAFGRVSRMELLQHPHKARTDAEGKFVIHGSRKHSGYVIEVPADVEAGYLPSQGIADDTAGYEPIDLEIQSAKGIILTGKLTNKSGEPLSGTIRVDPMKDNPYLAKLPTMTRSGSGAQIGVTAADGSYRLVVPPGPVIVLAGLRVAQHEVMYQPAQPDPKYPQYFVNKGGPDMYLTSSGGYSPLRGCWCKIIEPAEGDKTFTQDIALEPAKRKAVRVVDQDGKPVPNCDAVGIVPSDMYPVQQESLYVYRLEPGQQRLVVVCNQRTKQVGSAVIKESDADPVVTIGPGATVLGRAIDADGNGLAGLLVSLRHTSSEADRVFQMLNWTKQVVTDVTGAFRIEGVIPGQEFRIAFAKGSKNLGPPAGQAPRHMASKPGEIKNLGDVKVAPRDTE